MLKFLASSLICAASVFGQTEGTLSWLPTWMGQKGNYAQSLWGIQDNGTIYIGGHAGYCCYNNWPEGPGFEMPFVLSWDNSSVKQNFPSIMPVFGTAEFGGTSAVRWNDGWLVFGARTISPWGNNRARGWIAYTRDLMQQPEKVWWDIIPPYDSACAEWNSCDGIGPHMFSAVWMKDWEDPFLPRDRIFLFVRDGVGIARGANFAVWLVNMDAGYPVLERRFLAPWPADGALIVDVALGSDGLYGLSTGNEDCFYFDCPAIREYVSWNGGRTWFPTGRLWAPDDPSMGVADGGYIRGPKGELLNPGGVVAMIAPIDASMSPMEHEWHIHYWTEPGFEVPGTWGKEPGWYQRRARKHITPRGAVKPQGEEP